MRPPSDEDIRAAVESLRAENATMRDVIRTLLWCVADCDCDECPANGENVTELPDKVVRCDYIERVLRDERECDR